MTQPEMNPLSDPTIRAIVTKIALLPFDPRGEKTDVTGISDGLGELFAVLGTEDVGEVVASAVSEGLMTQQQGREVLGIATWSGETNGAELQATIERWLEEASSPSRIDMALAQGVFPFRDGGRMNEVLTRVSERHPEFSPACAALIRRRREQGV